MRTVHYTLAALVAFASVYADDTTYTIKIKDEPDVGKTVTMKNSEKDTGSIKLFDADGKLEKEDKPEGKDEEIKETTLERDKNGKDTKVLRTYVKARKRENGKETILSYEGATVLFEKRPNGWQLGVVGTAKITPKDADDLLKKFDEKDDDIKIEENLAPKKPVKVGEEWTLDNKAVLGKMKILTPNLTKSSIKAKLTKVFTKGTTPIGVIELDCTIVLDKAYGALAFEPPGTLKLNGTLTIAIDGSSTEGTRVSKNSFKAEGKFDTPQQKGQMAFDVSSEGTMEVSAEKDDPTTRMVPKVTWLAGADAWQDFVSKEHEFKAVFPGKPQVQTKKDANGSVTTQYIVPQGKEIAYIIAVTELPKGAPINAEAVLATLEAGMNVKDKSVIKLNGFPGRELKLSLGTKERPIDATQRVYVVNNRLYQALYLESEGKKGDMKKFYDGFRFDAKQAAKDD